jgi:hypothetical protein
LIACTKGEGKLIYQTPRNLQEIQDWVKDSFIVVTDYTSAEVQEKAPGFIKDYAMLVVFPKEYSIVYRSGHDKIDFRGAVSILNNIAKWMSTEETVNFGTEGKHLPPNMHQALGLSEPDSTHKVKAQAMWNKILQNPSIELKHKQGVIPGPGTKLKILKFTKEESSAIYKACKGLGYSITQATSAAVALTLRKQGGGTRNYTNYIAFDYQPDMQSPYNDASQFGAKLYVIGWRFVVSPTNFKQTADQFKRFVDTVKQNRMEMAMCYKDFVEITLDMMRNAPKDRMPALASMSHPGNLDSRLLKKHGDIEIEDFWSTVDIFTPEVLFTVWTWDQQLTLGLSYNDSYYDVSDIEYIQNTFAEFLLEGLELNFEKTVML